MENLEEETRDNCAVWDFRANEDVFTVEALERWMKGNTKRYAFQKEQSDSGYIHWQGRFSLIKRRTKFPLMRLLKLASCDNKEVNYLSPTAKVNRTDYFYAMKEDTRIDGPYTDSIDRSNELYIPRQYRDKTLYQWQKHVFDSRDDFNDRIIDVIVDDGKFSVKPAGCKGKSFLSAYLSLFHGSVNIPMLESHKDIIAYVCSMCSTANNRTPGIMFCDMPKAMNKNNISYFYTAMEQIKKGELVDSRYNAKVFWIDSPRIWVFTNESPDERLLTRDRWRLWRITDDMMLVPYESETDLYISALDSPFLDDEIVQNNELADNYINEIRITN